MELPGSPKELITHITRQTIGAVFKLGKIGVRTLFESPKHTEELMAADMDKRIKWAREDYQIATGRNDEQMIHDTAIKLGELEIEKLLSDIHQGGEGITYPHIAQFALSRNLLPEEHEFARFTEDQQEFINRLSLMQKLRDNLEQE